MSSFMPVLTTGIVRDSFYLLIFYSEKFLTWVWRLPFAVNVNLNLSVAFFHLPWEPANRQHIFPEGLLNEKRGNVVILILK